MTKNSKKKETKNETRRWWVKNSENKLKKGQKNLLIKIFFFNFFKFYLSFEKKYCRPLFLFCTNT